MMASWCVEFHSKMNAIGPDTGQMLVAGVQEAQRGFAALVIGNDAPNFSVGANLMLVLLEAQEGNWDELDLMVRQFQNANMALRGAKVPVVVAPAGMALGGGCEVALHGAFIQAAAETYMGLVELGVGVIPAGGGTKEMVVRACETISGSAAGRSVAVAAEGVRGHCAGQGVNDAASARELGFLRPTDDITMNRERLTHDAKSLALAHAGPRYQAQLPRQSIPVGGERVLAGLKLGIHLAWRGGHISDYDKLIAHQARVRDGGWRPSTSGFRD